MRVHSRHGVGRPRRRRGGQGGAPEEPRRGRVDRRRVVARGRAAGRVGRNLERDEEAWIGARGYRRAGKGWVGRALAFLGEVHTGNSRAPSHLELFVLDLPAGRGIFGCRSGASR